VATRAGAPRRETGRIDAATDDVRRRRSAVLLAYGAACVVGLALCYLVAVRTGWGQHLDDDALLGRSLNPRVQQATSRLLRSIDVTSLAGLGGAIVLIALARARVWLAVSAAILIFGATVTSEVLKRILARPELTHPDRLATASFPSGHTTVAASLAVALLIVVPPRWRGLVAVAGIAYAVVVGAATVTAGWHRPSDVVGAFFVTFAWATAICALLVAGRGSGSRAGRREARQSGRLAVPLLVVGALILAVVGFAFAGTLAAIEDRHLQTVPFGAAYAGSVASILAAGSVLVAAFLACLRGVVLDAPRRRVPPVRRAAPVATPR
jgi:membrane-associated phospholipid phosphatase